MSTRGTVRRARPNDHDAVGELTAGVYAAEGWARGDYLDVLRDVDDRVASADVLLAERSGRLLGAVTVATRGGPYAEPADPGEAVVRMLVVDPAERGAGVGRALVEACLGQARRDGCRAVRLWTEPRMAAAHRLYERLGFRRAPDRDWEPVPDLVLLGYVLDLPPLCDACGRPGEHSACRTARALEPPRYCSACGRRMVVQVTPTGWTARCVAHGVRRSGDVDAARTSTAAG